jgi:prepilin-type N-terminal cleavage/methylation domain-containing protein/prepilin-type processing-associated H-X9-DG protein
MLARRHSSRRAAPRGGFTLIELLVVISIIATLAALILPAIQNARETARRTECLNHIRNCGVAVQSYASARNGATPYLIDPSQFINWGDNATPNPALAPWTVQLLPYLEYGPLSERLVATNNQTPTSPNSTNQLARTIIKVFNCPDDLSSDNPGNLSYVINSGYILADLWGTDAVSHMTTTYDYGFNGVGGANFNSDDAEVARATGIAWMDAQIKIDQVSRADGSGHTLLFSENLQARNWAGRAPTSPLSGDNEFSDFSIAWPVPGTAGSTTNEVSMATAGGGAACGMGTATNKAVALQTDATFSGDVNANPMAAAKINANLNSGAEGVTPRPSSLHPSGVNAVFVDGHGKFISQNMDNLVFASLYTWDGERKGQNIVNDNSF